MVLQQAIQERYGFQPQTATIDDGILLTIPKGKVLDVENAGLLGLVTPENLPRLVESAVLHSPVFFGRFRHTAVRSLMIRTSRSFNSSTSNSPGSGDAGSCSA